MSLCKHVDSLSSLLAVSQALDHLDWRIEETCRGGIIDQNFILDVTLEKDTYAIFLKFLPEGTPQIDENYLNNKIFLLNERIIALVPEEPVVVHEIFSKKAHKAAKVTKKDENTSPSSTLRPDDSKAIHIQQRILGFSRQLDQIKWHLDDQLRDHPISTSFLWETKQKTLECYSAYLKKVYPKIELGSNPGLFNSNLHFLEKHDRLTLRLMTLAPIEPIVAHRQFMERSQLKVRSSSVPAAEIFDLTEIIPATDEPLSPLLTRISSVLCHGNDSEVLQVLHRLSAATQKNLLDALWVVRGRPALTECAGHINFGELLFTSSPQQKACAIALVKFSSVISDLISVVKKNDLSQLRERFKLLPVHLQNEIFKKHWEQMGSPTLDSSKEFLRKIAHNDFGRVSFLGLEERCDVFASYKVKTLEAYQVDFEKKIAAAQTLLDQIKEEWNKLALGEEVFCEDKVSTRKQSLHHFAKEIVPLFEGPASEIPSGIETSCHELARAYVEKYSCLKPFFLQLMNNL